MNDQEPSLPFIELGAPTATSTIVFIHGASGDGSDWDQVAEHLPKYRLLLPDLPAHGKAGHIKPLSKELAARLLAKLIRAHVKGGKAYIVALSMGAFISLELASVYPDVVIEMFISGLKPLTPSLASNAAVPYVAWTISRVENMAPPSLTRWALSGTELKPVDMSQATVSRTRSIMKMLGAVHDGTGWPNPWPARTCIINAGKRGVLPTGDVPADTIMFRDVGRKANPETMAYNHPLMHHPWFRQDPKLFAEAVTCWFEHRPLPEGFVEL
jgi:pimeloyl-ACP methyl ester carboxylesterase